QQGAFKNRREILKVPKLGPKAFEQSAGFLRIRNGDNPLDNTAVHPESYPVVKAIALDLQLPLAKINQGADRFKSVDLNRYVTDTIGLPTLKDIIQELEKPGRDPRAEFKYATFKEGVNELKDLSPGMELEGIVTNVVNFGAFVDIGVHQDGLVHISQLADRFVEDPKQIVKVGQVVKVRVMEVNEKLKRVSLSMRSR
ncbi:S1 RNA-binding domain-containing protein, partial [Moorena sp. SIO3B2]|uniref:S1 RNA-binding domain-containing protein n=1 Tax=Moorena sp. SIO3B2 TaxID=2607827 RepID=UPI0013CD9DB2